MSGQGKEIEDHGIKIHFLRITKKKNEELWKSPLLYICLMSSSSITLYNSQILSYFPALNTVLSASELSFLQLGSSAYHLFQEAFLQHNPDLNESPSFEYTCIIVLIGICCNYNSYFPMSHLPKAQSISVFK